MFRQLDLGFDQVKGGGVEQPVGLVFDGGHHLRGGMADHAHQNPAEKVEIAVAFSVYYMTSGTLRQGNGPVIVEADPVGDDLSVALQ